jgi:hypothetical protein
VIDVFRRGVISASAFALLTAASIAAGEEDRPGAWGVVTVGGPLGEPTTRGRWNIGADAQARYFDIGTGISQWLLRPSIGYRYTDGLDLRVGYGRFRTRAAGGLVVNEDRLFQDLALPLVYSASGEFDVRVRLEQRFVDISSDVAHVLRTRFRYRRPVANSDYSIEAHYEAFFGLNDTDWTGSSRLAQWRLYLGAGRPVGRVRLELGYLYQPLDREIGEDFGNHLAIFRIDYRFGSKRS